MTPAVPDQALASDVPSDVSDEAPRILGNLRDDNPRDDDPGDVECLDLRELDLRESRDVRRATGDGELASATRTPWHPGGGTRPGGGEWFMADGIVVARGPRPDSPGASR